MGQWFWIGIATILHIAAITLISLERRKMRRIMNSLNTMLDNAIKGSFSETVFDESLLSAVETKMTRFLSVCTISSQNLTTEKDNIKSLISDISHQTKTAISNILLYSQPLAEHDLPEECEVCVKALSAQAEKLNFLIGVLVKTSRLEAGIISVCPQRGKVQTLLNTTLAQIQSKAEAKEIVIEVNNTDGMAYYDPKWTTEALYNILDNAVKYSPWKSVIKINTLPYELFYRIDISDEGMGIPEEEQSKIFQRFYRSSLAVDQEGVGIVLFLTRKILSNGGGYIKVSSKEGKGTVFSVFLPIESR